MKTEERRSVRENVRERFGGRCAYCDIQCRKHGTVDHYMPKALGGSNHPANLRWACLRCNGLKGALSPQEWERVRPPRVVRLTRQQRRNAILASIAPRSPSRRPA